MIQGSPGSQNETLIPVSQDGKPFSIREIDPSQRLNPGRCIPSFVKISRRVKVILQSAPHLHIETFLHLLVSHSRHSNLITYVNAANCSGKILHYLIYIFEKVRHQVLQRLNRCFQILMKETYVVVILKGSCQALSNL